MAAKMPCRTIFVFHKLTNSKSTCFFQEEMNSSITKRKIDKTGNKTTEKKR